MELDRDPADGTDRPRELAHASHPWFLLISSGEIITQDPLGQLDRGGFWSFLPLGYADKDALALVQTRDPRPVERGDVYEDVLPATVPNNETEPLSDVYHFTIPISWTLASKGCRSNGDLELFRGGLGGAAVLLSTFDFFSLTRVRARETKKTQLQRGLWPS
jgi:hypothetical protein